MRWVLGGNGSVFDRSNSPVCVRRRNLNVKVQALLLALAFVTLALPAAAGTLVLDINDDGTSLPCGACGDVSGQTFGWLFDVTSTITVDGLGTFDVDADGIGRSVDVGLWRDNGDLLASVTVTNGSWPMASNGPGEWLFEDIAPTVLTPGSYAVGQVFFNTEPLASVSPTFATIPEVSFVEARTTVLGPDSGLLFPETSFAPTNVFGPNLRIGAVPEPSSAIIWSVLGAAFSMRRRRRQANA